MRIRQILAWAGVLASFAFILGVSSCMSSSARAEAVDATRLRCGATDKVEERLASKYQEYIDQMGETALGRAVHLYSSAGGKTWTLVVEVEPGVLCLIASGENWIKAGTSL